MPAAKTWQRIGHYPVDGAFTATTDYLLDESYMRSTYLPHDKVIDDHATIDDRSAIEFSNPGNSTLSELLWVDGKNYLPLQMVKLDSGPRTPRSPGRSTTISSSRPPQAIWPS